MPDIVNALQEKQTILTHVIDGFLIEESLSPFPVASNVLTNERLNFIHKKQQEVLAQEKDQRFIDENASEEPSLSLQNVDQVDIAENSIATCEQCGFQGPKSLFSSLKQRFCSLSCARRYAISHSKRSQSAKHSRQLAGGRAKSFKNHPKTLIYRNQSREYSAKTLYPTRDVYPSPSYVFSDSSFSECDDSNQSSDDGSCFTLSPSPSPEPIIPHDGATPLQPMQWTVDDVWRYIHSLPDSEQHADEFRVQEIDGSALLLLHEEHLITSMNLPLGPALKLCDHIDRLRKQESC